MNERIRKIAACLAMLVLTSMAPLAHGQNEMPQTTPEGMELLRQTSTRVVYAMPGATLDPYTKVALIDCYVAFKKDWRRDFNRTASFQGQVSTNDMERIKTDLAEEFATIFTEELTAAGYEIVDHTGEDVLIIRPALVNLDVTAPDVRAQGFSHTVVRSAGQMTLYMELFDSTTNAIIARVIDAQASDRGLGFEANRVTNRAEADRILRQWATELASHLGDVQETTASEER